MPPWLPLDDTEPGRRGQFSEGTLGLWALSHKTPYLVDISGNFLKSKVRLEGRAAAAVGQGPVQSRLHCMDSACDSPALAEGA